MRSNLILALLLISALLGIPTAMIWADPGSSCSTCTCSGNGDCSGCHQFYTEDFYPLIGYTTVPDFTFYNYCVSGGNEPCYTSSIVCYQSKPGTNSPTWPLSGGNCDGQPGSTNSVVYVNVDGCEP